MADKTQIAEIKKLARQGDSINEIKEKLELPKSTVYYHFRKEVGQKQKENAVKIPENDEIIGEICGIFAGDGYFRKRDDGHYRVEITLNQKDRYWEELARLLYDKLEKEPQIIHEKEYNRTRLRLYSKKLYKLLKNYLKWNKNAKTSTIRLKEAKNTDKFNKGFIRGLIDTDGYREPEFRRYIYGTISEGLRNDFSNILEELGIDHANYSERAEESEWNTMFKTRISGDSAGYLSRKIQPRHPKKKY